MSLLGAVAGLTAMQGACGGCNDNNSVGHLPDAPPVPDAAADAAPDAVSLTVINRGVPAVGVTVYFLDADGSLALAGVTDGNGIASAVVTTGGSVTAIRPFTTQAPPAGAAPPDELRTFLGVKPGDHLVLSRAATDSVTVQFDAAAPTGGDGGTRYQVLTTCGGFSTTMDPFGSSNGSGSPDPGGTRDLPDCHGAADIAVVATQPQVAPTAAAKTGRNPSGNATANAIATSVGLYHASASLPVNGTVPLSLRGDAYAPLTPVTFMYTNGPDITVDVLHAPIVPHGFLGPYSANVGGTATISEVTVPGVTRAVVDSSLQPNANQHRVVDWGPFSTAYSLDLGTALLREITTGPSFDVATGKITWAEESTGLAPDLTIAGITVHRVEPTSATWHWEVVAPYSASGIALPHLPTDVFDWAPVETDQIQDIDPLQNVRVTGGYDAVRAHILDIHDETGSTGYVVGNAGRASIVTWFLQR